MKKQFINSIKLKVLLALSFTGFLFAMYGQERTGDTIPPGLKKNVVYVTGGGFIAGIGGAAGYYGINAERMLWNIDGFIDTIWGRVSGGNGIIAGGFREMK